MPNRKPAEEQDVADRISTHRANLGMYRSALIQFLDKVEMDRVELNTERVIFRSMTITSKRLTRPVINDIIMAGLSVVTEAARTPMDIEIVAFLKAELKSKCDCVSYKGNLLVSTSAEAKRVTREGVILRRGDMSLVDPDTRGLCEAMWDELGQRHSIVEEGKAAKRARVEANDTASQATTVVAPSPEAPPEAASVIKEAEASPPLPHVTSPELELSPLPVKSSLSKTEAVPKPKLKSSISKTEAAVLFQRVAEYMIMHRREESLDEAVVQLVDDWWPVAAPR